MIIRCILFGLALIVFSCAGTGKVAEKPPRVRTLKSSEPAAFHNEIQLQVGWYLYDESDLEIVGQDVWAESFSDSAMADGRVPVIVVNFPDSNKTFTMGMDVDDALLGQLLKHSLMTQIPIERPLNSYLERADCTTCHPADVPLQR